MSETPEDALAKAKSTKPSRFWFATGSSNNSTSKPLNEVGQHWEDIQRMDKETAAAWSAQSRAFSDAYRSGRPIAPRDMPRRFSLIRNRSKPSGPPPFMLWGGTYMVVSAETRALLEGLAPGPLAFHPIEALNTAATAPLWPGAKLFLLQVLACRRAVVIEESRGIGKPNDRCLDGEAQRMVFALDEDDALVVAPPLAGDAELWIDDRLMGALFLSDRVAQALKAAKLARGWGLRRCRTKTVH